MEKVKVQKIVNKRARNFVFIIYPDEGSYVSDWQKRLKDMSIKAYTILHDKDDKKKHYHVIVCFDSPRTLESVKGFLGILNPANGQIAVVYSLKGKMRYLCHLDDLDKHQYDLKEVINFGGGDYVKFIKETEPRKESSDTLREMIEYVQENKIKMYCDFLEYCLGNNEDWWKALRYNANARIIRDYIISYSHKLHKIEREFF